MSNRPLVHAAFALCFPMLAAAAQGAHAQEAAPVAGVPVTGAPVRVYDVKAEALLQRAADRLKAAQAFSGQVEVLYDVEATATTPATHLWTVKTFRLQKPNLVYHEIGKKKPSAEGQQTIVPTDQFVSDGKKGVRFRPAEKEYRFFAVTKEALSRDYSLNFPEFFDPALSDVQQVRDDKAKGLIASLTVAPEVVYGGVPCYVVERKRLSSTDPKYASAITTARTYIGKNDGILRGSEEEWRARSGRLIRFSTVVIHAVIGNKLPASSFRLNLAGHLTTYTASVSPTHPPLLAAGTLAPDFTVYARDGKPVKLSDFRGKIVVLDFWATWCGPCLASLPHTTEVAKKTAGSGVVVLAVNVWDKKEQFDKWLPAHPQFSALTFALDTTPEKGQDVATKLYKVSGIPTQYVIDRDGKIVTSFVGFKGPSDSLEKAIAKADAKGDRGAAGAQK